MLPSYTEAAKLCLNEIYWLHVNTVYLHYIRTLWESLLLRTALSSEVVTRLVSMRG